MTKYPKAAEAVTGRGLETVDHTAQVLNAYFDFLELLYRTDNTGLADMLGVDPDTLKGYRDGSQLTCALKVVSRAADLTGIRARTLIGQ